MTTQGVYDLLRQKWSDSLTGGSNYNTQDPSIAAQLFLIGQNAKTYWSSMNTSSGTPSLWPDLPSTTSSAQVSNAYTRLRSMALAYATTGSQYQGNADLLSALSFGLDWMSTNRYNSSTTEYDNWWDWEIGSPQALNDTMVLLYSQLSSTQISNYLSAIDHFVPDPNTMISGKVISTGANRSDLAQVVIIRGIVGQSSPKISQGRDALSDVSGGGAHSLFTFVTSGDGFYADGSFIQHTVFAYTGSYGVVLLGDLARLLSLLSGSNWAVTDPNAANVYHWVYTSYEPLIYQAAMMDMVRGRAISRSDSQDHAAGESAISSIIQLAQSASPTDATHLKSMAKTWIQGDTFRNYFAHRSIPAILAAQAILNDSTIPPRPTLVLHKQYAAMDRVVHRRPTFGFGISMSSHRIANYESINGENLHGWYTGDGMSYLYTSDLGQFSNDFWATINPYRLPGTTVDTQQRTDALGERYLSTANWVGGAAIPNTTLGTIGMQLLAWNSTLEAWKSWFCLDDTIIALGSLTSGDNRTIETMVENRRLSDANSETLIVNGTTQSSTFGWSATLQGVNWINLSGTGGYYFPEGATLNMLREERTSAWHNINQGGPTRPVTRNYATIWFDHGINPSGATYAYVLLPGKSADDTASYSAHPPVQILQNNSNIQAVRETNLNVLAANFWQSGSVDVLSSQTPAAIILQQQVMTLTVSASDPQRLLQTLTITINIPGYHTVTQQDSQINVTQLSPAISFTVDVSSSTGASYSATFSKVAQDILAQFGRDSALTGTAGYYVTTEGTQHVIVELSPGALTEVYWRSGQGVHQDTLTTFFNSRMVDIGAYFNPDEGNQHAIVATSDGALTEVYWRSGQGVHRDTLTTFPAGIIDVGAYFNPDEGSQHAIVSLQDGSLVEVYW